MRAILCLSMLLISIVLFFMVFFVFYKLGQVLTKNERENFEKCQKQKEEQNDKNN